MSKAFITFKLLDRAPERKTDKWEVWTIDGNWQLGIVEWFTYWRKYIFTPIEAGSAFDETCLREIATFIESETRKHKEAKV